MVSNPKLFTFLAPWAEAYSLIPDAKIFAALGLVASVILDMRSKSSH
jgi:hypothetical protein